MKQEDGSLNWAALEDIACGICKSARFSASMLGAFDLERAPDLSQIEKQKSQRQRRTNVSNYTKL